MTLITNIKNFFTIKFMTEILIATLFIVLLTYLIISVFDDLFFFIILKQGNIFYMLYNYLLPASTILFSVLVIALNNPIYSLICLIIVFINMVLLLLSIKAEFLALVYLIVYIGAIAILFLFVIMMFNLQDFKKKNNEPFFENFLFFSVLYIKLYYIVCKVIHQYINYNSYFTVYSKMRYLNANLFITYIHYDILLFGNLLYTYFSFLFILSGFILLSSMIGAIVLALSTIEKIQK